MNNNNNKATARKVLNKPINKKEYLIAKIKFVEWQLQTCDPDNVTQFEIDTLWKELNELSLKLDKLEKKTTKYN